MNHNSYPQFGSMLTPSAEVDFSAKSGMDFYNKNFHNRNRKDNEGIAEIWGSAVGDFTERPLQIMIREIAKNFLIFTPIGWIILLFIVGRKYKSNLSYVFKNMKDVVNSLVSSKPA